MTINNVPGKTLRDKFNYLSQFDFDWRNIPGTNGNQKLKFIIDTLEKSKSNKFKTVFMGANATSFKTRNGSGSSLGLNVTKDDITESILMDAYKSDDINFFMIVLNNIHQC